MRQRLPTALAAVMLALSLGGCVSLLPKAKPAELYRFGAGDAPLPAPAADARSIALGPVVFPQEAVGDGILTVENEGTAYITGARWVAPASTLFHQALEHAFMAQAPHIRIEERGEPGPVAAVLSLEVVRFDARYQGAGAPTVEVSIRGRLIGDNGATLATRDFAVTTPADANRVGAIVAAYGHATDQALGDLAQWVQANAPAAPPAPRPAPVISTSSTTSTKSTTSTTTRQP